jgi:hypothetical protein
MITQRLSTDTPESAHIPVITIDLGEKTAKRLREKVLAKPPVLPPAMARCSRAWGEVTVAAAVPGAIPSAPQWPHCSQPGQRDPAGLPFLFP